jgi:hypothetical protein
MLKPSAKQLIEKIPTNDKPVRIEIDPHNTLLKEATVKPI